MRHNYIAALLCLLVLLVVSGCSSRYKLKRERLDIVSPWPFMRGEVSAPGAAVSATFSGRLDVLWQAGTSGKAAGPLVIHHGNLVFADAKKKIRFYDLATGDHRGKIKCKGIPQTGVVIQDSVAYFCLSPKENRLYAINLLNRKVLWEADVKDASPGSIFVSNRLIVSSAEGEILAWETDGRRAWRFAAEGRFPGSVSSADGKLFQPGDQGILYVLAADDGAELYRVELEGPLMAPPAIDRLAFLGDLDGNVYALDPSDGAVVWRARTSGSVWASPAVTGERVYLGTSRGEVVSLDAATGRTLWTFIAGEVIKAAPLVVGGVVITGTAGGLVVSLDATDGSVIDSTRVRGSIDVPPVTDGERVYVATDRGKITCLGDGYDYGDQRDQRKLPEDGS